MSNRKAPLAVNDTPGVRWRPREFDHRGSFRGRFGGLAVGRGRAFEENAWRRGRSRKGHTNVTCDARNGAKVRPSNERRRASSTASELCSPPTMADKTSASFAITDHHGDGSCCALHARSRLNPMGGRVMSLEIICRIGARTIAELSRLWVSRGCCGGVGGAEFRQSNVRLVVGSASLRSRGSRFCEGLVGGGDRSLGCCSGLGSRSAAVLVGWALDAGGCAATAGRDRGCGRRWQRRGRGRGGGPRAVPDSMRDPPPNAREANGDRGRTRVRRPPRGRRREEGASGGMLGSGSSREAFPSGRSRRAACSGGGCVLKGYALGR